MITADWRPPTLETERLVLRAFAEDDAAPLFVHASNPNVTRYTLWEHHKSLDETLHFVRDYARCRYFEGVPEPLALCLKPERSPIGAVGCFWVSMPNKTMELGYWIGERYWGRGLIAEGCRAAVAHAFAACGPERMQARVVAGNAASVRVLEKLGFQYEGTLRRSLVRRGAIEDVMVFAKLRGE